MNIDELFRRFRSNTQKRAQAERLKRAAMEQWISSGDYHDEIAYIRADIAVFVVDLQTLRAEFQSLKPKLSLGKTPSHRLAKIGRNQVDTFLDGLRVCLLLLDEAEDIVVFSGFTRAQVNARIAEVTEFVREMHENYGAAENLLLIRRMLDNAIRFRASADAIKDSLDSPNPLTRMIRFFRRLARSRNEALQPTNASR
ncbi:MAG: hypothetical protein SGJ27_26570 [Candidatus Melainabacteria bacterium]|nr:hypothetical protein [Candidatus Melainabacteria bacterium]